MSIFFVIKTQTCNSFLNIAHESLCLTNDLTVGKKASKQEMRNRHRTDEGEAKPVCWMRTPAIPPLRSWFRSFRLNEHKIPCGNRNISTQNALSPPFPGGLTVCCWKWTKHIDDCTLGIFAHSVGYDAQSDLSSCVFLPSLHLFIPQSHWQSQLSSENPASHPMLGH